MALITLLQKQAHQRLGEVVVQRRTEIVAQRHRCVYCGNADIARYARDENCRQRFRCHRLRAEFNALTSTVLARMRHPGKWVAHAADMADHKSVYDVAASGIGISADGSTARLQRTVRHATEARHASVASPLSRSLSSTP